jgi:hypothetical protein
MQTMRIVEHFDVLKHTPTGRFSIGAMRLVWASQVMYSFDSVWFAAAALRPSRFI